MTSLIRLEAPGFVAGVVIGPYQRVETAAPVVRYMRGWDRQRVLAYADRRHWRAVEIWNDNEET